MEVADKGQLLKRIMKQRGIKWWVIGLLIFLGLVLSCVPDAPHSNPIDPYNQNPIPSITLQGHVLRKYEPHLPISNCQVLLFPEEMVRFTDSTGSFTFRLAEMGVHQLIFRKTGFTPDTVELDMDTLNTAPQHFYLNAEPYVRQITIFSEYIDQWWPEPFTTINFWLIADDPDGLSDIDTLRVLIPDLGIVREFQETVRPDSFRLMLTQEDFPEGNPFPLVGKDIFILLEDRSRAQVTSGPYHLIRIMEQSPVAIEPTALQEVSARPLFRWEPYPASFAFQYEVSVFRIQAGIPILIHQALRIPATQFQYQYPDSLSSGTYFWTIGVRDEFNNLSRSKEASFVVP